MSSILFVGIVCFIHDDLVCCYKILHCKKMYLFKVFLDVCK